LIPLSPRARRQVAALADHYDARSWPEAIRNLLSALRDASAQIERDPAAGPPALRPVITWRPAP
jgi:plasmid stabilization system protein ParE